ncbi:fructosamine kinase family protein [Nocardioides mangrovicus]|nr:fructosamine kinase family protein [Nocardioides mangrovicus]
MPTLAQRVERLLGVSVVSTSPVAGGDVCTTTKTRLSDGRTAVVKTRAHAPEGFFPTEAEGLGWLAEAGAPVPEVLAVDEDCLILAWVEPGRATPEAAASLGRTLAAVHAVGAPGFGGPHDGFIGRLPMPNGSATDWPEFYATKRVLPYLKLAVDRQQIAPTDAADVELCVRRLTEVAGPAEPPARLHGDLWSGNVVFAREGAAHLVDPAAYGGHRETDLAMLSLFGLPQLPRLLEAYQEVSPLAEGWQDRIGLHQLFPLLVHACQFGSSYGARAGAAARAFLG